MPWLVNKSFSSHDEGRRVYRYIYCYVSNYYCVHNICFLVGQVDQQKVTWGSGIYQACCATIIDNFCVCTICQLWAIIDK